MSKTTEVTLSAVQQSNPYADNLYDVLGVSKTANPTEIRRAYRVASMRHHPDRNGGSEDAHKIFQKIKAAYEILSNIEQREFYDNTDQVRPDDQKLKEQADALVNQVFAQVLDLIANSEDESFDVRYIDPMGSVINAIRMNIENLNKIRSDAMRAFTRQEHLLKKFTKQHGDFSESPLSYIIKAKIQAARKQYSMGELDLKVHNLAITAALDYVCIPETRPTATYSMFSTSGATGFGLPPGFR